MWAALPVCFVAGNDRLHPSYLLSSVLVAALTGRMGSHSTAWLPQVAAAIGTGSELPQVVLKDQTELLPEGGVVGAEIRRQVSQTGSHDQDVKWPAA
jgi:hypothetical protein